MSIAARVRRAVFGAPKDVKDPHAFHKLSLVALLAWVGLGADGLSSSAYGPDEAFRALGEHTGFAVFLALATALTVFIISYGYSRSFRRAAEAISSRASCSGREWASCPVRPCSSTTC
jgi:hypothetical protein